MLERVLAQSLYAGYLVIMIENYLSEKSLWYRTEEGLKEYIVTAKIPRGSELVFWYVMYVCVPGATTIVGFVDNLTVVVAAKNPEDVEVYTIEIM